MQLIVGTTAEPLGEPGGSQPVIQNLGPGKIAIDNVANVSMSTGLVLPVGEILQFYRELDEGSGSIFVIADTPNTDVRVLFD